MFNSHKYLNCHKCSNSKKSSDLFNWWKSLLYHRFTILKQKYLHLSVCNLVVYFCSLCVFYVRLATSPRGINISRIYC